MAGKWGSNQRCKVKTWRQTFSQQHIAFRRKKLKDILWQCYTSFCPFPSETNTQKMGGMMIKGYKRDQPSQQEPSFRLRNSQENTQTDGNSMVPTCCQRVFAESIGPNGNQNRLGVAMRLAASTTKNRSGAAGVFS